MNTLSALVLAGLLAAPALAFAQATSAPPAPASAAAPGPRMGMGGMGMHGGARWGRADTPGWSMMTPAEREQHRQHMQSMHSYDECKAYMTEHHALMAERAKARGRTLPAPRRDACAGLKP